MSTMNQPAEPADAPWTLGDRLKKARTAANIDGQIVDLSQEDLAKRIALTRQTIGKYEKGDIPAGEELRTLAGWALATGYRYQWILTGQGPWRSNEGPDGPSDMGGSGLTCYVSGRPRMAEIHALRPTG